MSEWRPESPETEPQPPRGMWFAELFGILLVLSMVVPLFAAVFALFGAVAGSVVATAAVCIIGGVAYGRRH